jgi:tetratricopeptide (TPR) repeat protein
MSIRSAVFALIVLAVPNARPCEHSSDPNQTLRPYCKPDVDLEAAEAERLRRAFERRDAGDHAAAACEALVLSRFDRSNSRFDGALRWMQVALREAEASDSAWLRGVALIRFGNLLQVIGDYPREKEVYAEAKRFISSSDGSEWARIMQYSALVHQQEGKIAIAEQLLEDARDLARDMGDTRLAFSASVNLADIAIQDGRPDDAERHLRDAAENTSSAGGRRVLKINEALVAFLRDDDERAKALMDEAAKGAPDDSMWQIENNRGVWAEERGALDEAEQHYRRAMDIIEGLRKEAGPTDVKAPFLEKRWKPFQRLFALQLRRNEARAAFATQLRVQGRMFIDALALSAAEHRAGSAGLIQGAIERVDFLDQLVPLLAQSPLAEPVADERVLAALREQDVGHVLTYFAGHDRMYLLVVVNGEPRMTSVNVPLKELRRLADDFVARPGDERLATRLGAALLPDDALPPAGARIHIVPTSGLLRVSFAALRVQGQLMLERNEIAYGPSALALGARSDSASSRTGRGIVIADSQRDLSSAKPELDAVVELTRAAPAMGRDATASKLQSAKQAPHLHIIAHSGLNGSGGYLSLVDGDVSAADILRWGIRPRLAVIPTCGSAITHRGEMWGSLASAFLAAGSEHVVATLASVQDSIAADFSRLFYTAGGLEDPVGGTTRALRAMAKRYPVSDWSAFIVAGR